MWLDLFVRYLVVYMLHRGHGELAKRPLSRTVERFWGRRPANYKMSKEVRAVRAYYAAAYRLAGHRHPPGWRSIG